MSRCDRLVALSAAFVARRPHYHAKKRSDTTAFRRLRAAIRRGRPATRTVRRGGGEPRVRPLAASVAAAEDVESDEDKPRAQRQSLEDRARGSIFRPEVLVVVGAVAALAFVLKPWAWEQAQTDQPRVVSSDSRYPDIEYRASRAEPVSTAEVRAKFFETKPAAPISSAR